MGAGVIAFSNRVQQLKFPQPHGTSALVCTGDESDSDADHHWCDGGTEESREWREKEWGLIPQSSVYTYT